MDDKDRVRENRLRRKLKRMGYRLTKNRVRDPKAWNYGGYMIFDLLEEAVVAGGSKLSFTLSLEDVEQFTQEQTPNRAE